MPRERLLVVPVLEDPRRAGVAAKRRSLLPIAILSAFILAAAVVNAARWGNPLVFADYGRYLGNLDYPDRAVRT